MNKPLILFSPKCHGKFVTITLILKQSLFLFLLLIISIKLSSQTYQDDMDSAFMQLNTSNLTTKILSDKGKIFTEFTDADGLNDTVISVNNWLTLYNEYYNSFLIPQTIISIDSLYKKLEIQNTNKKIPILWIQSTYEKFIDSAIEKGYIDTTTGFLFENPNNSISPYQVKTLMCASLAEHTILSMSPVFSFSSQFYFGNINKSTLSNIQINFDDGNGFINVAWDNDYSINYSDTGEKIIQITFVYNGTSYLLKTFFNADRESDWIISYTKADSLLKGLSKNGHLDLSQYTRPEFYTDLNYDNVLIGKCTWVPGYDANGQLHINVIKPLIIVEGIDFPNKKRAQWDDELRKYGGNGLGDFLSGKQWDYKNNRNDKGKWDATWPAIIDAPLLLDLVRKSGYDILYVDFADGATSMETNAKAFISLIKYLNDPQSGVPNSLEQDITVLGASMGGQVAKYALSYMETNNIKHNCRLYLSFDSPHLGANIPIGLQDFISYYQKSILLGPVKFDWNYHNICLPAAKQLLTNHVSANGGQTDERTDWLSKVDAVGNFPKMTRNIGLVNGSVSGTEQPFPIGTELAWFGGSTEWFLHAKIFACPGDDHSNVAICKRKYALKRKFKMPNNMLNFDNCPGSRRADLKDLKMSLILLNGDISSEFFTFIPTYSALDYPVSNIGDNLGVLWNVFTLPNSNSHFEAYYGQETNQDHVMMNLVNGDWVNKELLLNENDLPTQIPYHFNYSTFDSTVYSYNFSNLYKRTLHSVQIIQGGIVSISGGGDASNYHLDKNIRGIKLDKYSPTTPYIFKVNSRWRGAIISAENGGILQVGNESDDGDFGLLTILEGSKLIIKNGGILKIFNNSRVVIEEGAILEIEPGAIIQLIGNNSILEIRGKLIVDDNATFSFTGNGFIKYNVTSWQGKIQMGQNSKIELTGNDDRWDKILEVTNQIFNVESNGSNSVSIKHGSVELGDYSFLNISCPITMEYAAIRGIGNNFNLKHRGLTTYGQQGISLRYTYFESGEYGYRNLNYYTTRSVTIDACTFLNNKIAIYTYARGARILNCLFNANNIGYLAEAMDYNCEFFSNAVLSSNLTGIDFTGTKIFEVNKNPLIESKIQGIINRGSNMYVACTNIKAIETFNSSGLLTREGIYNDAHASLYMNDKRTKPYAGASTVLKFPMAIQNNLTNYFTLNNGLNNIYSNWPDGTYNGRTDVSGTISVKSSVTSLTLPSNQNRWYSYNTPNNLPLSYPANVYNYKLIAVPFGTATGFMATLVDNNPKTDLSIICPAPAPTNPDPIMVKMDGSNYFGESMKSAIITIVNGMYGDGDNIVMNANAVSALKDFIVNSYNSTSDPAEKEGIIEYCYTKMNEAFGRAGLQDELELNSGEAPAWVNDYITAQNFLLNNLENTPENYNYRFKIALDNAIVYRTIGDYNSAEQKIDSIRVWVADDDKRILDYWYCAFDNEKKVLSGEITIEELISNVNACKPVLEHDSIDYTYLGSDSTNQERTLFTLVPNPATDDLDVVFSEQFTGEMTIEIRNSYGALVNSVTTTVDANTSHIAIAIDELTTGIYQLIFINGDNVKCKVFMKM